MRIDVLITATSAVLALVLVSGPLAATAASFDEADLNGDGFVTIGEYAQTHPFERRRDFHQADRRKDRRLDRQEYNDIRRLIERKSYRGD
ncbi:MAG: hypothetical protein KTR21_03680 [Rhodobacteraceae bacterium]|nr:hypothetical protein [Paracoccaceae bacterium]